MSALRVTIEFVATVLKAILIFVRIVVALFAVAMFCIILTALAFVFFASRAEASVITETFDTYTVGSLTGQSDWTKTSGSNANVTTAQSVSAPNSNNMTADAGIDRVQRAVSDPVIGTVYSEVYTSDRNSTFRKGGIMIGSGGDLIYLHYNGSNQVIAENIDSSYCQLQDSFTASVGSNGWHYFQIEWDRLSTPNLVRFTFDATVSDWIECGNAITAIDYVGYGIQDTTADRIYGDNFVFLSDTDYSGGGTPSQEQEQFSYEYIVINAPEYGETLPSTSVDIDVDFTSEQLFDRPTTTRNIRVYDALTLALEWEYNSTLGPSPGDVDIVFNVSTTTVLTEGTKLLQAVYRDEDGRSYTPLSTTYFNVATNTYYQATGIEDPLAPSSDLTQNEIECDTLDVACQLQKALIFLFKPSAGTLDKFTSTWTTLSTKKPFGYITVTIDQFRTGFTATGTTPYFDLGTIPFMDTIFQPFNLGISGILWGIYFVFLYQRRLKHLEP